MHIAKILIEVHEVAPGEIAVLTPYSAQKAEIKRQMERQDITGVEVKTITESQGKHITTARTVNIYFKSAVIIYFKEVNMALFYCLRFAQENLTISVQVKEKERKPTLGGYVQTWASSQTSTRYAWVLLDANMAW